MPQVRAFIACNHSSDACWKVVFGQSDITELIEHISDHKSDLWRHVVHSDGNSAHTVAVVLGALQNVSKAELRDLAWLFVLTGLVFDGISAMPQEHTSCLHVLPSSSSSSRKGCSGLMQNCLVCLCACMCLIPAILASLLQFLLSMY